jgi:orotidine-5'-phosphate decarboxylase
VVCAGSDVAAVKRQAPRMMVVVPGLRPAGTPAHDQFTAVTPAGAIAAGADLLVVGRAVTAAEDPAAAAVALEASLTPPP